MAIATITSRRCVEWILAVVLLFAAGMKADSFLVNPTYTAIGMPGGKTFLAALIEIELVLGIWLLVGGFLLARFFCTLGCFLLFAVFALNEAIHSAPTCGCFGNVTAPPAITASFDSIACAGLWLTRPRSVARSDRWPTRFKLGTGATAVLLATATLSFAYLSSPRVGSNPGTASDPAAWLHRPFVLLNSIDGDRELKQGRWLLIFYRYGCDDCRRAIPNYTALAAIMRGDPDQPRLAFVAVPPYAPAGQDPVLPSLDYLHLTLRGDGSRFAATPVVVALQDGNVMGVDDGEQAFVPPDVPEWHSPNRSGDKS